MSDTPSPEPPKPIRVAFVEDIEALRATLAALISESDGLELAGVAATGEEAVEHIPGWKPHVVVMDILLPGISGVDCVRILKEKLPETEFMMLTIIEDHDSVYEALRAGATGYLVKRLAGDKLVDAIRELVAGGAPMSSSIARRVLQRMLSPTPPPSPAAPDLSLREEQVLRLLASGQRYKEIAESMGLSVHTVRTHLHRIYRKLQVRTKTEAVRVFRDPR